MLPITRENMHIGEHIHSELKKQGRTVTWFAKTLNIVRPNAYNIFTRRSIDSELLFNISRILNHDFFKDLSEELGKVSTKNNITKQ